MRRGGGRSDPGAGWHTYVADPNGKKTNLTFKQAAIKASLVNDHGVIIPKADEYILEALQDGSIHVTDAESLKQNAKERYRDWCIQIGAEY